jgi:hypothetical protein
MPTNGTTTAKRVYKSRSGRPARRRSARQEKPLISTNRKAPHEAGLFYLYLEAYGYSSSVGWDPFATNTTLVGVPEAGKGEF